MESLANNEDGKAGAAVRLAEIAIDKAEIQGTADEEGRELTASEARKMKRLDEEAAQVQDRLDRAEAMETELAKVSRAEASYGSSARILEPAILGVSAGPSPFILQRPGEPWPVGGG